MQEPANRRIFLQLTISSIIVLNMKTNILEQKKKKKVIT